MIGGLKKYLPLFASLTIFIFIFIFFSSTANAAIVHCGTVANSNPCSVCDIVVLAKNIIDFIITKLAPAIATLFYLWAGFTMILRGANPTKFANGKTIIWNTTIGIVILLSSWMIVNTILISLAGDANVSGSWFKIECTGTGMSVPPGTEPPPITPAGSGSDVAKRLITSPNLIFSTDADCPGYHAKGNINDIAGGLFPYVCSPGCSCVRGGTDGKITVNPAILTGLESLGANLKLNYGINTLVISLTTGRHSTNSPHYTGSAVDVVPGDRDASHWRAARTYLNGLGGKAICELNINNIVIDEPNCDLSKINHIHWTLKASEQTTSSGTCQSTVKCTDADVNICRPNTSADCSITRNGDNDRNWDTEISAAAAKVSICPGLNTFRMLKAIMSQESHGKLSAVSESGTDFGLMQLQPATANAVDGKSDCTADTITAEWLRNEKNASASICIAAKYLKSLVSGTNGCGCDARQLAAGYNGSRTKGGACAVSANCGPDAGAGQCSVCADQFGRPTRRWECLWDDNAHTDCNATKAQNFSITRQYAPKVEYCYSRF